MISHKNKNKDHNKFMPRGCSVSTNHKIDKTSSSYRIFR